jgi:hypothetical protein
VEQQVHVAQAPLPPVTPVSELRFDGATVTLPETASVRVAEVKPEKIELVLERGYVDCDVTHRPSREFILKARGVTVRDVGTRFRVAIEGDDVNVSVTEGEVAIEGCDTGRVGAHGNARCRSPVPQVPIPQAVDEAAERLRAPADERADSETLHALTHAIELASGHGLVPTATLYQGQLLERLRREDEAARLYQAVAEDVAVSPGVRENARELLRRLRAGRTTDRGHGTP